MCPGRCPGRYVRRPGVLCDMAMSERGIARGSRKRRGGDLARVLRGEDSGAVMISSSRGPCRVPDMCEVVVDGELCARRGSRSHAMRNRKGDAFFECNACDRNRTDNPCAQRDATRARHHWQHTQRHSPSGPHPVLSIGTLSEHCMRGTPRISPLHQRAIASQRRPYRRS